MEKILIYGDSNVWGDNFNTGVRIKDEQQWPNILQDKLNGQYKIYQEGLPGRLAGNEERKKPYKNGKDTFLSTFRTIAPIENVIIMLGTNDLQLAYNKTAEEIIKDLLWYKETIINEYKDEENKKKYFVKETLPRIIFILPMNFDYKESAKVIFNEESENKRKAIIEYFKNNMSKDEYIVLNNMSLFEDGIHLNYEGHQDLATIIERTFKAHE